MKMISFHVLRVLPAGQALTPLNEKTAYILYKKGDTISMFIRDESFQTFIRRYPIVTFLVAAHIIVFLLINFTPFSTSLYHFMVGSNYYITAGEYWRLFTPIVTHEAAGHLIFPLVDHGHAISPT